MVYSTAGGRELHFDLYQPRGSEAPTHVVLEIHGGGWNNGSKAQAALQVLPYLRLGMTVIVVEYRLAKHALAPAAVEDCRCALRWIVANASRINVDPAKIVVSGASSGGHLALMTGLLSPEDRFDADRDVRLRGPLPSPAAVVNRYGASDLTPLVQANQPHPGVRRWLGNQTDSLELARRLSPVEYVASVSPPVFSVHGDRDDRFPYESTLELHRALQAAGVAEHLYTFSNERHGRMSNDEVVEAQKLLEAFLRKIDVLD
ncbi:MAG: alpha/beta hydrolase [Acidobacteriota bacterium]